MGIKNRSEKKTGALKTSRNPAANPQTKVQRRPFTSANAKLSGQIFINCKRQTQ
jgi:hypothetical protein